MFVNLTELYFNGSVSAASHAPSPLVRTAVVAQKFKTLSLTFARNVSMKEVNFTIVGKTASEEEVVVSQELRAYSSYMYLPSRNFRYCMIMVSTVVWGHTELEISPPPLPPLSPSSPPPLLPSLPPPLPSPAGEVQSDGGDGD